MADPDRPDPGAGRVHSTERATSDRALDRSAAPIEELTPTRTSMTTAAPPLEKRPVKPLEYPWITRTVDLFLLAGSALDPEAELAAASIIWTQCGIDLQIGSRTVYDERQTRELLGENAGDQTPVSELIVVVRDPEITPSMQNLRNEWTRRRHGDLAAFFAPRVVFTLNAAPSAVDPKLDIAYIGVPRFGSGKDLAHEIGHILIGSDIPHRHLDSPLMRPNRDGDKITDLECRAARGDHRARGKIRELGQQKDEDRRQR